MPPPDALAPSALWLRRPARLAALVAAAALLAACDSGGTDPPPTTDDVFFGVNYTRLYAAPTDAEISAVQTEWEARNTMSSDAQVVAEATVDGARVAVVRHTVAAVGCEAVTHYAAVRVPPGIGGPVPLLVVHHGGDDGFSVGGSDGNNSLLAMAELYPDLFEQTVQVAPVYRSEELRTGVGGLGGPYTATGGASPWDCDVDDAIASVQAAVALLPEEVDPERRAALGFSRGGNTAALHAVRDPEMDALVDYYGPTDFYNDAVLLLTTGALRADSVALRLPGVQYLRENVLLPLRGPDGAYDPDADYATARLEVLRRSASVFEASLPDTQVHHHYRDGTVPYTFSAAFAARAAAGAGGTFDLFSYGAPPAGEADLDPDFHDPAALAESLDRVETFLLDRLDISPARAPAGTAR